MENLSEISSFRFSIEAGDYALLLPVLIFLDPI